MKCGEIQTSDIANKSLALTTNLADSDPFLLFLSLLFDINVKVYMYIWCIINSFCWSASLTLDRPCNGKVIDIV